MSTDSIQLKLRKTRPVLYVWYGLAVVLTLGLLLVVFAVFFALAWSVDGRPVALDREGMSRRRRSRQLLWSDVVEAEGHTEYVHTGTRHGPARWYVKMQWRDGTRVHCEPFLYENGDEGLEFLERQLGRAVRRPLPSALER